MRKMPITKIEAENFTVFKKISIPFCNGLNVFVGENGVGKTHIMKLAYAACQASKHDVSFSQKTVMIFRPEQSSIGRLVNRKKDGKNTAKVTVSSDTSKIWMTFSTKTKKWDADVTAKLLWEKQMSNLTSVFIPAKEILSNAWNLEAAVKMGNVEFDDTYLDIIAAAKIDISRGNDTTIRKKYLDILQKISSGKVTVQDDRFYLKPGSQAKLEFNLVAEGLRKIALLWQLIKNGTLEKGSVLFWDEPEANINPIYIPVLAELLIMLEHEGVQIFVSTHDYFLAKYIDVKRQKESNIQYISLYFDNEDKQVKCEIEKEFGLLEHNAIMETFRKLYKEEVGVMLQ
jgi:predicted ATP-dependent endonuclease of OLD family